MIFPRLADTNQKLPPTLGYVESTENAVKDELKPEKHQGFVRKEVWKPGMNIEKATTSDIIFYFYR